MLATVVGKKKTEFTPKEKNSDTIRGMNLHLTIDIEKGGEGKAVEKVFISDKKDSLYADALQLNIGDLIDIRYNRYGKVDAIYVEN